MQLRISESLFVFYYFLNVKSNTTSFIQKLYSIVNILRTGKIYIYLWFFIIIFSHTYLQRGNIVSGYEKVCNHKSKKT